MRWTVSKKQKPADGSVRYKTKFVVYKRIANEVCFMETASWKEVWVVKKIRNNFGDVISTKGSWIAASWC